MKENLATVLEVVADVLGDHPAVVHGDRTRTWAELDDRAACLAAWLDDHGVGLGDRVAIGLLNGCEYVETVLAVLKVRATPVNINYRYKAAELRHVLADADAAAVVFDPTLGERVAEVAPTLPRRPVLLQHGGTDLVEGATDLVAAIDGSAPMPRIPRGDEEWLLYTGGTTGLPKGVQARHSWVWAICVQSSFRLLGEPTPDSLEELAEATAARRGSGRELVCMPAAPLMHGVGMYNTMATLQGGGTVVFAGATTFDPAEVVDLVARHGVTDMAIVGDAFARPLADELDDRAARGEPADLAPLRRVRSVGAVWSAPVKRRLLRHGRFTCQDMISASEGGPFAISIVGPDDEVETARFRLTPQARLLAEDGTDVVPGSDTVGLLAAETDESISYLGAPDRTAATFRWVGERRYVVPGDMAMLEADGTLVFKGRGSGLINTGGEKVHAEEVEHVLLNHPDIAEAVVVGVPDPRWGHRVAAVVALRDGAAMTLEDARGWVGTHLADYKRPRDLVVVDALQRSPAGKADLRWARAQVTGEAVTTGGTP